MLAAHRCGGRTSFLSFARAWDRFTGAARAAAAPPSASCACSIAHLEASLAGRARAAADLGVAIAEHQAIARARRARDARRLGLGWLRDRRDAERARERLEREPPSATPAAPSAGRRARPAP